MSGRETDAAVNATRNASPRPPLPANKFWENIMFGVVILGISVCCSLVGHFAHEKYIKDSDAIAWADATVGAVRAKLVELGVNFDSDLPDTSSYVAASALRDAEAAIAKFRSFTRVGEVSPVVPVALYAVAAVLAIVSVAVTLGRC